MEKIYKSKKRGTGKNHLLKRCNVCLFPYLCAKLYFQLPMKKLCLILALLHAALCQAQTFIFPEDESIFTEYNDGRLWAYRETDGCVVGLTCFEEQNNYGRFYQIHAFVKNIGNQSFIFWPDSISANISTKRGEIQPLSTYTHEDFQRKIKRNQIWSIVLADEENPLPTAIMMEDDRKRQGEGYLKTTTIYPDEAIVGHMNIRYKKGRTLTVHIPINGHTYSFSWDVSKKKRSK